jgi:hypothetical protein
MQVALAKDNRKCCYVNCWSVNPYESNVMWGAYLRGQPGVAIQTTYKNLKAAFEPAVEKIIAGKVHYLDFDADFILERDGVMPCMSKRMSFVDERELRLFNWNVDEAIFSQTRAGYETQSGLLIEADLEPLIARVYLHPRADAAFRQEVESLSQQCGSKGEVLESELGSGPRT